MLAACNVGIGSSFGNLLWQLACWPEHRRYLDQLNRLEQTQRGLLREALTVSTGSAYGRQLAVDRDWDYRTFRESVPTCRYEDLAGFLEQARALSSERVRVWEPTGGSTGPSKWIPWTASLQAQFRRAVAVWVFELFRHDPALRYGRSYWQLTPKASLDVPNWLEGQRVGFESDGDYLGAVGKILESLVLMDSPLEGEDFWRTTVSHLSVAKDLRLISCWSPSFLLVLREKSQQILGSWKPQEWWPHLRLISCWTQGPSALLMEKIQTMFGDVKIQAKGLLSTEAVTSIPLLGRHPLAYRSHFFEFQDSGGNIAPCWELDVGGPYRVLQTTGGGLLRYDSGDLVEVTGFLGQVPCLKFLARDKVSDHFGEKLSLVFLNQVLSELGGFARIGFESNSYVLYLDESQDLDALASRYKTVRERLNTVFTYRDCRQLEQLKPLRLYRIQGTGEEQLSTVFKDELALRKPTALLPPGAWSEQFRGHFLSTSCPGGVREI